MHATAVNALLKARPMRGGKEHRVAYLDDEGRVLKVADVHAVATGTLYDYLTDLLLNNLFFDDDLQMLGCFEDEGRVYFVVSQPYVNGTHPDWTELKTGLVSQGLRDPYPRAQGGNFIIDHDVLGEVDVYDLHVNNVIRDAAGWLHPIDAHFYFDDRASRTAALETLGLDRVSGPTALAASGLPSAKD
jgi:Serine/Threonine/Tyrosine Kinase found in polyvalent proteins